MVHLQCVLPVPGALGVATRVVENAPQTVVLTEDGLVPIIGNDSHSGLTIGPELSLYKSRIVTRSDDEDSTPLRRAFEVYGSFSRAVWDHWSNSIYAEHGNSVIRIKGDEVSLVAGVVDDGDGEDSGDEDGPGNEARFPKISWLASDGAGSLYIADVVRLRKVKLPASWQASKTRDASAAGTDDHPVVSTLPFRARDEIWGLVHVPGPSGGPGSLVFATNTAFYRVKLGGEERTPAPVLLAGAEGQEAIVDGKGEDARFQCIYGLVSDADGNIICVDWREGKDATVVRCVAPDGTVSTLVDEMAGRSDRPCILPNGYLGMHINGQLMFLDMGLKMQPLQPPQSGDAGPPPRTLQADLGQLLEKPESNAYQTLQLGDRTFKVHRLILSTRCDYFKQRLAEESGFADGAAAQLTLPDADPEAFALVLRYIYTGAVDIPAALACPVAELADRLLLPELCVTTCKQVLAGVVPEKVVDLLLWAERCAVRGSAFPQLLEDLKAWFVKNYDTVKEEAAGSLERHEAESSELMSELYGMLNITAERPAKRARKH